MEIEDGFKLEDHGWKETADSGDVKEVFGGSRITAIRETFERGVDVLCLSWSSPTSLTAWSLNGTPMPMTREALMRAVAG